MADIHPAESQALARAMAFHQAGRPREALSYYDEALLLVPDNSEALYNRGCALQALTRHAEALASYEEALAVRPNFVAAHNNRGNALLALGRMQEAVDSYGRALAIEPDHIEALANRAAALCALGQFDEALEPCERALSLNPDHAAAHYNRSAALFALGRPQEALANCDAALTIKPDNADALCTRANILRRLARFAEAVGTYERLVAVNPDHAGARFALCMAELPILYADEAEIERRRRAYARRLSALCNEFDRCAAPADWADVVGSHQPFYLPYQGRNDRKLQACYGSLVCRIMAARYPQAQLPPPPAPHERVRFGIVSGYFRMHSNWKLHTKGTLTQLDRGRFSVFCYHTGRERDGETEFAAAHCERFVQGPLPIERWREEILSDAPHVLLYPEIGMDGAAPALAAQRLARVQCTRLGQPVTSGFPTMDYFLSSDLQEPPEAEGHYTERLIRLPNLSFYYEPFAAPPVALSRQQFGLRQSAAVYWCGQSLFKYLPQFDCVFARIAQGAPDCQFAFIEYGTSGRPITALFQARLDRAFAAFGLRAADHCVFLPRLDFAKYSASFDLCDVFLDSIGWSGHNTTMESLPHALPVVTMGGQFMRGRHTLAILQLLGVTETIAESIDDYVALAVRLAGDAEWRLAVKERMAKNEHKAYRDRTAIVALEEFLHRAARHALTRAAAAGM